MVPKQFGATMAYTKTHLYGVPFNVYLINNGPPSSVDSGTATAGGSFTGNYLPEWKNIIKRGGNATTTASGSMAILDPGFIDFQATVGAVDPNNHTTATYGLVGIPRPLWWRGVEIGVPSDVIAEVTNRCIRKFLEASDSARSSIEAGQDLGEWKETLHGLIHPLNSLREFTFSHLSKVLKLTKTVKHKASLSKMVADTWLEFKFGWNPLAADIGDAYAAFTNNRNHVDVQPIRASARGSFRDFEEPVNTVHSISIGRVVVRTRVTGYYSVTMKGAIRTGAVNGSIGTAQLLQLDAEHFVPTIWDLLPYSWIADYFTNIGDTIRSLSYNFGNLAWGVKTIRTTHQYDWTYSMLLDNLNPAVIYLISREDVAANPSGSYVNFQRTSISPGDLIPQFRVSLPLGSVKPWENMAALLFSRQKEISRVASNIR
jgi:hypothetical protein